MDEKPLPSKQEILESIKELKSRMPAHSIKPSMIVELEELEELLARCFPEGPVPDKNRE